jgi:DNA-binding MarR family transcriptional regulator
MHAAIFKYLCCIYNVLIIDIMKIEDEIKSVKPMSPLQKAGLNIMFTGGWLKGHLETMLKPYDISNQQYNVLRILRGRHPEAANLQDISERMLDRMSNATRLVEKLRIKNYVTRDICPDNRRKVEIRITAAGLELLKVIDPVLDEHNEAILSRITVEEAEIISNLLEKLRD